MTQSAEMFCMQYAMRRGELLEIADEYRAALEEDHRVNADMFDIHNTSITGNLHPNATMRTLEKRLGDADLPLLDLLGALLAVGTDMVLGLDDFSSPEAFLEAAAAEFERREAQQADKAFLAGELTRIKAEHQCRRLDAAMAQMRVFFGE